MLVISSSPRALGLTFAAISETTGIGTSNEDWIRGIAKVFNPDGVESKIVYRPEMPSGPSYVMDIENCRELLGYEPKYDFLHFLEDFKAEMALNRFKDLR